MWLAFAAAATGVVSIAASHTLLALAFIALLLDRKQLRLPPFWPAAAAFMAWTLISLAVSDDPASGVPQVRKFYVFLMPIVVFSTFRARHMARSLYLALIAGGTLSALWSFVQFFRKWRQAAAAHQAFYEAYVSRRITGFMSHWMTFSGEMMICLLLLGALVIFAKPRLPLVWSALCAAALSAALVLALTRSMWPATAVGLVYLLWFWKRWAILLLPVAGGLLLVAAPDVVAKRVRSIYKPDQVLDSNQHREVLRRTGLRMIEDNPLFGVGPQQVKRHFEEYMPADAPRPIPKQWWYDHLHNVYIHYTAERGIPAVIALLGMFAWALRDFARGLKNATGDGRAILHGAIAVMIALLVAAWWEVNLGDSEVLGTCLAIMAAGYAALEPGEAEEGHA